MECSCRSGFMELFSFQMEFCEVKQFYPNYAPIIAIVSINLHILMGKVFHIFYLDYFVLAPRCKLILILCCHDIMFLILWNWQVCLVSASVINHISCMVYWILSLRNWFSCWHGFFYWRKKNPHSHLLQKIITNHIVCFRLFLGCCSGQKKWC